MFNTSNNFQHRIRESGKRKTVVDILSSAGTVLVADIPVSQGSVKVDRNSAIRRSGTVEIPNRDLVPSFEEETLKPFGTEIRIRQGIVYGDGSEELIPVGTFILDTTSWQENTGPIPTIEFFDRAMVMERAEIGPPLDYAGWLPSDVIEFLVLYFWPEITVDFDNALEDVGFSEVRVPGGAAFTSGNHWDVVQYMARRVGAEIYFDVFGNCLVRKLPVFNEDTTTADAVWEVTVGETGILTSASKSITRDGVYNSVYVIGGAVSGGNPPSAGAQNLDPDSPTYREGPFRRMGIKITDNTLTSDAQCLHVAQEKLAEVTRLAQTVSFNAIPNPAVDVGDIVAIQYLSGESQAGIIESFSLPIGSGEFSGEVSVARV